MNIVQNQTEENVVIDEQGSTVSHSEWLTWAQDQYIAYTAFGGLIPDLDGDKVAVKMTATNFAKTIGVARQTLYDWRESIPDFWELVSEKRREMGSKERLTNVWNGVYLKATTGNAEAAKLYLANFDPNFKMPAQKVEHEAGDSLVEAIGIARKRQNVIEAEIVDDATTNA